jgi:hypothetical protein
MDEMEKIIAKKAAAKPLIRGGSAERCSLACTVKTRYTPLIGAATFSSTPAPFTVARMKSQGLDAGFMRRFMQPWVYGADSGHVVTVR